MRAPIKKRIHTDMSNIIVGDARRVLFVYGLTNLLHQRKRKSSHDGEPIDLDEKLSPSKLSTFFTFLL